MSTSNTFTAQILEASASAYAGYAASLLLERHQDVAERYAPSAMRHWKASLTQRVLELSAALGAEEPRLFSSRVRWVEKALRARDQQDTDFRSSLSCLREVLIDELPASGKEAATRYLDEALKDFGQQPADGGLALDPSLPADRLALRYLQAALDGDSRQAIDIAAGALEEGLSPQEIYLQVLLPAQREVGGMWHLGELNIAEEHFVTTTTERAMAVVVQQAPRKPVNGKTMIACAVAGNTHGIGVRALADFFEIEGWRSICLGVDVPASDLATAAVYFEADLLMLSAALPTQVNTVSKTVRAVRAKEDLDVKILVGGFAFSETPDLWQRLGADGYAADAATAVDLGSRLVGL